MKKYQVSMLIGLSVLVSAVDLYSQNAEKNSASQGRVEERIRNATSKAMKEKQPIDFDLLLLDLQSLGGAEFNTHSEIEVDLGELLLYEGNVRYKESPLTGMDPALLLRHTIIDALSRLKGPKSAYYLKRFYEKHGGESYPDLPAKIKKLGGTVPRKTNSENTGVNVHIYSISAEEKETRRIEVQKLVEKLKSSDISREDLDRSIQRIGEIGEAQDAQPIIKRLQKPNTHWVVKQNAYSVLGKLGGDEVIKYLLEQLKEAIPDDAKPDDYSDTRAILRAQAALALGECGDPDLIGILTKLSEDGKQFQRIRQACRKAASQINERFE